MRLYLSVKNTKNTIHKYFPAKHYTTVSLDVLQVLFNKTTRCLIHSRTSKKSCGCLAFYSGAASRVGSHIKPPAPPQSCGLSSIAVIILKHALNSTPPCPIWWLTWGQDASWRRGAGRWTAWFGCCGPQSRPGPWRCSGSPSQGAADPAPHSWHYSGPWNKFNETF